MALKIDVKAFKVAYVSLAFLVTICAIVAAYYHQQYVALGFIVLASAIILIGSMLLTYMYKIEKEKKLEKM